MPHILFFKELIRKRGRDFDKSLLYNVLNVLTKMGREYYGNLDEPIIDHAIHSFNKYLNICYGPGTLLHVGKIEINTEEMSLFLWSLHLSEEKLIINIFKNL